jgi:hypothetical protein
MATESPSGRVPPPKNLNILPSIMHSHLFDGAAPPGYFGSGFHRIAILRPRSSIISRFRRSMRGQDTYLQDNSMDKVKWLRRPSRARTPPIRPEAIAAPLSFSRIRAIYAVDKLNARVWSALARSLGRALDCHCDQARHSAIKNDLERVIANTFNIGTFSDARKLK